MSVTLGHTQGMGRLRTSGLTALSAAVLLSVVAGCASSPAAAPTPRFKTAIEKCHVASGHDGLEYADRGASLILSTEPDPDPLSTHVNIANVICVLDKLGASAATKDRMFNTRALDGMQDARWKGIDASWTYHPDDGFNLSLEDKRLEAAR